MNNFSSNMLLRNNMKIASLRSSLNTQTKIQIRKLTLTWIRAKPELAGALKNRSKS